MKKLLPFILFFMASRLFAQDCNCSKSLDSLQRYIEINYAGAKDKLTKATKKEYEAHNHKTRQLAKSAQKETYCLLVLYRWLRFFQDHHVSIQFSFPPDKLKSLITAAEKNPLDAATVKILGKSNPLDIEGVYHTADNTYKVAVVKSPNGFRSHAAYILESRAPEWRTGELKFELVPNGGKKFDLLAYNRAHHPVFSSLDFSSTNGLAANGWVKEHAVDQQPATPSYLFAEETKNVAYYKQLNPTTGYLRIQSFDGSIAGEIDSVVKANHPAITGQPNLIIDLRNNGGGSDFSYRPLRPLIYTGPVTTIGLDMLATPENIRAWNDILEDASLPKDVKQYFIGVVEKARAGEGTFVSIFADETDTMDQVLPQPQQVSIVINKGCGSTTEQFLLLALQSKKVTIYGEPSQGVLDYSNVRAKQFHCPEYQLAYATTRSRRLDIGQGIDNKGIRPHVKLDLSDNGWLDKLVQEINREKQP